MSDGNEVVLGAAAVRAWSAHFTLPPAQVPVVAHGVAPHARILSARAARVV